MSSRFLIVAPIAVIVTVALFFLMRDLIAPSSEKPEEAISETISLKRKVTDEKSIPKKKVPPPDITEPDAQPASIDHDSVRAKIPTNTRIEGTRPIRPGGDDGPVIIDVGPIDGGASPIIRPKPQYPACGKGVGEVVLDYVVEPDGSIRDVKVVRATSPCFARAAERATARWRYRPKVEEGKAVRSGRKRVTLVFEEEK